MGAQQQILTLKFLPLLKGGRRGGGNRERGKEEREKGREEEEKEWGIEKEGIKAENVRKRKEESGGGKDGIGGLEGLGKTRNLVHF